MVQYDLLEVLTRTVFMHQLMIVYYSTFFSAFLMYVFIIFFSCMSESILIVTLLILLCRYITHTPLSLHYSYSSVITLRILLCHCLLYELRLNLCLRPYIASVPCPYPYPYAYRHRHRSLRWATTWSSAPGVSS